MSSPTRVESVAALLAFAGPLPELQARLRRHPWDYAGAGVPLEVVNIAAVLQRYLPSQLTPLQVEEWANVVELRDDVEYDGESVEGRVLHVLANPRLEGALTSIRAAELISTLEDLSLHQ